MTDHPEAVESTTARAVVIGAGPAGLAAAAALRGAGISPIVLESGDRPGARWTGRYDRLHLHTARRFSSLPGMPLPRQDGLWVSRDSFVDYLEKYRDHHRLDVRTGTAAAAIRRSGDQWIVEWAQAGRTGRIATRVVVVATGLNAVPHVPEWPGASSFAGELLHSSEYRNPRQLRGKRILVVGAGNSGAEIAAELAGEGRTVELSIRTAPNIVRRDTFGIPSQSLAIALARLPVPWADRIAGRLQRWTVGDLTAFGIPPAPRGVVTQHVRDNVTPTIDVGLLDALRAGTVRVVPAVESFGPEGIQLADGTRTSAAVVVAATGFRPDVRPLVGALPVLSPSGRPLVNGGDQLPGFPGLYFIGFANPFGGHLRQFGIDARAIARSAPRRYAS